MPKNNQNHPCCSNKSFCLTIILFFFNFLFNLSNWREGRFVDLISIFFFCILNNWQFQMDLLKIGSRPITSSPQCCFSRWVNETTQTLQSNSFMALLSWSKPWDASCPGTGSDWTLKPVQEHHRTAVSGSRVPSDWPWADQGPWCETQSGVGAASMQWLTNLKSACDSTDVMSGSRVGGGAWRLCSLSCVKDLAAAERGNAISTVWTAVFQWGHVIISLRQYKHFFLWIVTFLPMMHTCTGMAAHTGCRIRSPDLWLRGKSRGSGTNPSRRGRGQA